MVNCTKCAAPLITIRMRIGGTGIVFQRCGVCESNSWRADDVEVSFDRLLALVPMPADTTRGRRERGSS